MNKSNIEADQTEQQTNNEQTAQDLQVCQTNSNTNVSSSILSFKIVPQRLFNYLKTIPPVSKVDFENCKSIKSFGKSG